jgi:LmbE family N-acetylglucosaminyl deacetylase
MRVVGGDLLGASSVLAIGAHADDVEIGCGGTLLRLVAANPRARVTVVVLSASPERADEARASARALLGPGADLEVVTADFRDGYLPYAGAALKERFDELGRAHQPDVVFTGYRDDLHQDHRLVSELTWNTFRDHLVLEYEVPKFDGDLGSPNAFVEIDGPTLDRKVDHLLTAFPSQAGKDWFTAETFRGLARLRGIECRAASGYAEAFYGRKLRLA